MYYNFVHRICRHLWGRDEKLVSIRGCMCIDILIPVCSLNNLIFYMPLIRALIISQILKCGGWAEPSEPAAACLQNCFKSTRVSSSKLDTNLDLPEGRTACCICRKVSTSSCSVPLVFCGIRHGRNTFGVRLCTGVQITAPNMFLLLRPSGILCNSADVAGSSNETLPLWYIEGCCFSSFIFLETLIERQVCTKCEVFCVSLVSLTHRTKTLCNQNKELVQLAA